MSQSSLWHKHTRVWWDAVSFQDNTSYKPRDAKVSIHEAFQNCQPKREMSGSPWTLQHSSFLGLYDFCVLQKNSPKRSLGPHPPLIAHFGAIC